MLSYAVHRKNGERKGEIVRFGIIPYDSMAFQIGPDEEDTLAMVSGECRGFDLDYVTDWGIEPRPEMTLHVSKTKFEADGEDVSVITGIPENAKVVINDTTLEVPGGTLNLRANAPAVYEVTVQAWPYIDRTVTVEAE